MTRYDLELIEYDGLPVLASPKFLRERSIHICFTTRLGGVSPTPYDSLNLAYHVGDDPAFVTENRRRVLAALGLNPARLTTARQVHGSAMLEVGEGEAGAGAAGLAPDKADALVTAIAETPIAIFTADCVPVVLADVKTLKLGVVHAGFKGIYSLIVPQALAALRGAAQIEASSVYAFIGPSIGSCCYEVDEARAALFDERFVVREAGKTRLDLAGLVRGQLKAAGLATDNISDSGICACCRKDLFFSFRRDGVCGRQMAVAALLTV